MGLVLAREAYATLCTEHNYRGKTVTSVRDAPVVNISANVIVFALNRLRRPFRRGPLWNSHLPDVRVHTTGVLSLRRAE
jgi:hypothetical protein